MGSPFGELTVIVNPHAGRRRVGQEIPELERTLQARGLVYRLLSEPRGPVMPPGSPVRPCRAAADSSSLWEATERCTRS